MTNISLERSSCLLRGGEACRGARMGLFKGGEFWSLVYDGELVMGRRFGCLVTGGFLFHGLSRPQRGTPICLGWSMNLLITHRWKQEVISDCFNQKEAQSTLEMAISRWNYPARLIWHFTKK